KAVEARVREGLVPQSTFKRLKQAHDEHYACLEQVHAILSKENVPFREIAREQSDLDPAAFEQVITVGGDGTLLAASHMLPQTTPVLGIRSSASSVGYLCGGSFDTLEQDLSRFLAGQSETVTLQRLRADVTRVDSQTK